MVTDLTIDVQSEKSIASLNRSAIIRAMMTLSFFRIKTNQDQVLLNKDNELSKLSELARSEDQEKGVR